MARGKITGSASYQALEDAFAAELAEVANEPGARVWVLVPTNLLALHLRREAARRMGGLLGVEFLTLKDAARRMALPFLASGGRRPVPAGAIDLVLQRLLDGVPDGSYFAAFRRFSNGAPAIERTFRLLQNCLWTPEALRQAIEIAHFRDPGAARRMRELAGIWADLEKWKQEKGLFDADDLILAAGRDDVAPADHAQVLLIYGFYDLNPAQRALTGRLIATAERCSAFLLWDEQEGEPAPGFEYAWPAVRWLRETLGADSVRPARRPRDGSDLGRLVDDVFKKRPFMPGREAQSGADTDGGAPDGSVRILSCPGQRPEAVEVAREVLRSARGAGEGPDDAGATVGVLLRSPLDNARLLAESFERAGIAYYVREGLLLAETVTGRVALTLLELAAGEAERASVIDFLALAQVEWPSGLSASSLDRLSRQAGILKGRRNWKTRLQARADQLHRTAGRTEDESERTVCQRDAELCTTAAGFLDEFFQQIQGLASCSSWRVLARLLHSLVDRFGPTEDDGKGPVLEVIGDLAGLDVAGTSPGPGRARWLVAKQLTRHSLRRQRFQHVGVTTSGIMGARGVTFDVVIVPGLIEKAFPRHIPEHSLLTELDREALVQVAPRLGRAELPMQKDRPKEERYLFRIALGSARRAVVLTYARLEENTGRPRTPSRFIADTCAALGVQPESDASQAGLVHSVPLNRRAWDPQEMGLALDAFEYDAAVFAAKGSGSRPIAYLQAISSFFRRAVQMQQARWRQPHFSPYDGKIRSPDLIEHLQRKHSRFGPPVSATRFETYARCPFGYFLRYVLGIGEIEAPSEEFQLPALERGSLIHEALGLLYEECLKGRALGELSPERMKATLQRAGELLDQVGRVHAENHPATWAAERERTLDEIRALLAHERDHHGAAAPAEFEYAFGFSPPTRFTVGLGAGTEVSFRGRIDRIDRLPEGAIQVVDYKTGKGGSLRKNRLLGGRQLQLPIYLLAAAEHMKAESGSALYLLVSGPKDVPEFTLAELKKRMADFRKALRLIVEGIAAGDFFPLPADSADARGHCAGYCPFRIVCGAARSDTAEMKRADAAAARLHKLREID